MVFSGCAYGLRLGGITLSIAKRLATICLLTAFVALAGCKEVLYSNLDETEANQMVAVLQAADIDADRSKDADGVYAILVEKTQIGASVLLLQNEGLPRKKFTSLGEIFADTGIVGTPFEERARFMHALNQELADTISAIDGVREARVHIVLPETARFDREGKSASAAVAVYYRNAFDAQTIVPTIKTMMAHSVPELKYDDVAISLFAAGGAQLEISPARSFVAHAEAATPLASGMLVSLGGGPDTALIIGLIIAAITAIGIWSIRSAIKRRLEKGAGTHDV